MFWGWFFDRNPSNYGIQLFIVEKLNVRLAITILKILFTPFLTDYMDNEDAQDLSSPQPKQP